MTRKRSFKKFIILTFIFFVILLIIELIFPNSWLATADKAGDEFIFGLFK